MEFSSTLLAFFHGFILALGLILPLGPQNMYILNQGMTQPKWWHALPAAITAGVCDTALILLAVLGVSVVVVAIPAIELLLIFFGILFLSYIGYNTWRHEPHAHLEQTKKQSIKRQVGFALSVSLLNPHAILDSVAVLGTSSLAYKGMLKVVYTVACISVSWLFFLSLVMIGQLIKRVDSSGKLGKGLNRFSAIIMWVSAVYMLSLFIHLI